MPGPECSGSGRAAAGSGQGGAAVARNRAAAARKRAPGPRLRQTSITEYRTAWVTDRRHNLRAAVAGERRAISAAGVKGCAAHTKRCEVNAKV